MEDWFEQAIELDGEERESFVQRIARESPEAAERLRTLLAHDAAFGRAWAAGPRPQGEAATFPELTAGRVLCGAYRLVRPIGRGGMGVVWEAQQERPRRLVAVKFLSAERTTPTLRRRFEVEAEVLGRLRHPGIAQIFEAALAPELDERPFFAMELVHGAPITTFADGRGLDTRARLELFVAVCTAVQHAHERGVLHRDLKPSNILVEDGPEGPHPKVLDFGVARASDPELRLGTLNTSPGEIVGTLAYMSPEQVVGDPDEVDVRADVWGLGAVLYQLVVGVPPRDLAGLPTAAALRVVAAGEIERPSALRPELAGDVDTILQAALAPEKERRYASAAELAADVRRHLEHLPIAARPPSVGYVLAKFARRHSALVVGLAATFASLVAGLAFTLHYARGESRAREEAELRFDDVRTLAQKLLFEIDDELAPLAGSMAARRALVATGLEYVDRLPKRAQRERPSAAVNRVHRQPAGRRVRGRGEGEAPIGTWNGQARVRRHQQAREHDQPRPVPQRGGAAAQQRALEQQREHDEERALHYRPRGPRAPVDGRQVEREHRSVLLRIRLEARAFQQALQREPVLRREALLLDQEVHELGPAAAEHAAAQRLDLAPLRILARDARLVDERSALLLARHDVLLGQPIEHRLDRRVRPRGAGFERIDDLARRRAPRLAPSRPQRAHDAPLAFAEPSNSLAAHGRQATTPVAERQRIPAEEQIAPPDRGPAVPRATTGRLGPARGVYDRTGALVDV